MKRKYGERETHEKAGTMEQITMHKNTRWKSKSTTKMQNHSATSQAHSQPQNLRCESSSSEDYHHGGHCECEPGTPGLDYEKNQGVNFTRAEFLVIINHTAGDAIHDLLSEGDSKLIAGKNRVKLITRRIADNIRMQTQEKRFLINRILKCEKILVAVSDMLDE